MACETLSTPGRACLNIPLLRYTDRTIPMRIVVNGEQVDLSTYDIRVEITQSQNGMWPPVSVLTNADLTFDDGVMTWKIDEDDAVYQRRYGTLYYEVYLTKDEITTNWLHGQLIIE